jgi:hypothetical protein
MKFGQWIRTRKAGDNPRGDFIKDTISLGSMVDRINDWRSLEAHMFRLGACDGAIEAGKKLWDEYERSEKREKKISTTIGNDRIGT